MVIYLSSNILVVSIFIDEIDLINIYMTKDTQCIMIAEDLR